MSIRVQLRFFAVVREQLGSSGENVELATASTVADLFAALAERHPSIVQLRPHLRCAVNMEFVSDEHVLYDGDEVAFIPPVAGGCSRARVTDEPLDPDATVSRVRAAKHGAVVTFQGVVRNHSHGETVAFIEYEAYAEMARSKLDEIAAEIGEKWPECDVQVDHRTGHLEVGDIAIVIAVASPHRKEAFSACQYMIDEIKQRVPIWKREVGPDGASWVGMGS